MHIIQGKVIKGKQRGRDLGFPTANVLIDEEIPQGIYISRTRIQKSDVRGQKSEVELNNLEILPSVTFIGNATTFGESDVKSETYVLDFDGDLYGKMVTLELLEKIRGNEKFESVEKLVENMKVDIEKARKYFENLK